MRNVPRVSLGRLGSRRYVPLGVTGCIFLVTVAARVTSAQEVAVASQGEWNAPVIRQSGAVWEPNSHSPSALVGEQPLMVPIGRVRFSVALVGLQPQSLRVPSAVGRPVMTPDERSPLAAVPDDWPQPSLRLAKLSRNRSDVIAYHLAAGLVVGAAAGYVVYRSTPEKKDCDPKEGDLCGAVRAGAYMAWGVGIGMPVGALIGFLRTRT